MLRKKMIVVSRTVLAAAILVALAVPADAVEPASPPGCGSVTSPAGPATTTTAAPTKRGFSIDPNG
jgi:hypothetical protein